MLKGFYLNFSDTINKQANAELHAVANNLMRKPLSAVTDILPGYTNLYIEYDAAYLSEAKLRRWIDDVASSEAPKIKPRQISIDVNYNGEDLADIAEQTGLSVAEVIKKHSEKTYHVYAMGFTPGFPFMAEVDEAIRLPRKAIPRTKVPAHTVAMAGAQTGIYPLSTPGGWNLLGTVIEPIFDPYREESFLLQAGDEVRFSPSESKTAQDVKRLELLVEEPIYPVFKVQKAGLQDLLVDKGRFMAGRFGLGRGGALDAPLAKLANQLLGNPSCATLLELTLMGPVLEVLKPTVIAVTGHALIPVLNGETLEPFHSFAVKQGDVLSFKLSAKGARSYLAVAGGFESKTFMGSASVDQKGFIGRALLAGDVLGQAHLKQARAGRMFVPHHTSPEVTILRLSEGPQANSDALNVLQENTYTVASADRMGIRFEGQAVPGSGIISEAVPIGAIQVTSGGMPILLLNDRGTLGGYAKPALVHPHDLAKAAQLRKGSKVRFKLSQST